MVMKRIKGSGGAKSESFLKRRRRAFPEDETRFSI
jgi:hypothetical protein